jgi:hypothetical protein
VAEVEAEVEMEVCIGGGGGRGGRSRSGRNRGGRGKSGRGRGMYRRRRHALEALECIGRAWRQTELMEPAVNTKCQRRSKQSELVRTCRTEWYSSGVTSAACRT